MQMITIWFSSSPIKSKTITQRHQAKWYTSDLGNRKCALRKLERISNQSKLAIDADIYQTASDAYKCLYDTKVNCYNSLIFEAANNQGTSFSQIDKLLHHTSAPPLPLHESTTDVANRFADFLNKIDKVYKCLSIAEGSIFRTYHPALLNMLTTIINLSLETASVPASFKEKTSAG